MKLKWALPFASMYALALPPPQDMAARVCMVVGILSWVAALLAVIQPWKPDPQP